MSRPILVLRPEPGNSETLARLLARKLDGRGLPLFKVESREWDAPDPARFTGLLITSANAIWHGGPKLDLFLKLPVFAVGKRTAAAAVEAGFSVCRTGESDVATLVASLDKGTSLLHLRGADAVCANVAAERIVYSSKTEPMPPHDFATLLANHPVALLHSARAAESFAQLAGSHRAAISIVAISAHVARAAGEVWEAVAIASEPRDDNMIELAARMTGKP